MWFYTKEVSLEVRISAWNWYLESNAKAVWKIFKDLELKWEGKRILSNHVPL